ncbi:MAG: NFACT RNA binding domain-containing protein, partial [Clostridiaceae bacterium]
EENALDQIILANEELSYLNSVSESIQKSEDPSDIAEIKNELMVAGYIRFRSGKKKKESPSKPMQFQSTEGFNIFVGKNNNQNDYLTTKFAAPEDTWLHTKNYPGSHVIIKGKGFNEETLLEAANLAAYYSKASGGSKVQVDYTLIKYVKKPSGSKPGMVTYTTNKSVYIDPDSPRIKRV